MKNNSLYMYALFDKESQTYDCLSTGLDDAGIISFYLDSFKDLFLACMRDSKTCKENSEKLLERIHNSLIYKLAYFDNVKGEFINDLLLLADLSGLTIDDIINKKINESEENN